VASNLKCLEAQRYVRCTRRKCSSWLSFLLNNFLHPKTGHEYAPGATCCVSMCRLSRAFLVNTPVYVQPFHSHLILSKSQYEPKWTLKEEYNTKFWRSCAKGHCFSVSPFDMDDYSGWRWYALRDVRLSDGGHHFGLFCHCIDRTEAICHYKSRREYPNWPEGSLGGSYSRREAAPRQAWQNNWITTDRLVECPAHVSEKRMVGNDFAWNLGVAQPFGQALVSAIQAHTSRHRTKPTTW
jgi:hypothetical protein